MVQEAMLKLSALKDADPGNLMNAHVTALALCAALLNGLAMAGPAEAPRFAEPDWYWVEPMKKVHARFTGVAGTFAHFGDSITVTMAYWAPLANNPQKMSPEMARARQLVMTYQKPECWNRWKGPDFGNNGSMTIRWARDNVEKWLKKLNPEVVLIMFGSNDVGQMDAAEYETKTREVVTRSLSNGTVVILSSMPPRSGLLEKSRQFADVVLKIAMEQKLPVVDYFGEILKRRPADWDGALPKFKDVPGDEYQVPTLIARDGVHPSNPKVFAGDYSEEALRSSGYGLRNFLTLMAYAEVIERVLQPLK
jgi:lysophospholipase L1-like esterase